MTIKIKEKRLEILKKLILKNKLDLVLVFGSWQDHGAMLFFTGMKPVYYHYFYYQKSGKSFENGLFVPEYVAKGLKDSANFITFEDQTVQEEMAGFLKKKKRIGLIGKAPAIHFSSIDGELVFLDEEISAEMCIKSEEEIKGIRKSAQIVNKLFTLADQLVAPKKDLKEITEKLEEEAHKKADNLAFPVVVTKMDTRPNLFTWFSPEGKISNKDTVYINIGIEKDGLFADVGRMFFQDGSQMHQLYKKLKAVLNKFVKTLQPGKNVKELAGELERETGKIDLEGFSLDKKYLGHSCGFALLESPAITQNSKAKLKEGMVISLIMQLSKGNQELRFQEMVVVRKAGGQFLS